MPVVELSYSRLQKLVGKVSKKQISDSLPFLGLDIESEDKDLVRVEYSPNRPDYSTDLGIALGLQGLFGIGRRRKKSSIGIHDLDKISFPLLYTTTKRDHRFVPLNSDKELTISEILDNTDVGQDYGAILGNSPQVPLILDSKKQTVSFPPIINAAVTTVTTKTKNLFVEVTGINKDDAEDMLSVVATILQTAGFALVSTKITGAKNTSPKLEPKKILINSDLINQMLGLNLTTAKIISSLKKSRLDATLKGKNIVCSIPSYRFDIFGPMDLV